MKKILLECNGHYLFENNDHFWVTDDKTGEWFMVNMYGTKKGVISHIERVERLRVSHPHLFDE